MLEHGGEDKIAEEAQQATKALMHQDHSDAYRIEFSQLGAATSMVHVLQALPTDRGAVSLTCDNLAMMIGPAQRGGPGVRAGLRVFSFDAAVQSNATAAGAAEQVLDVLLSGAKFVHKEHQAFNFDINAAYNVERDCFRALANLAHGNDANKATMMKAGLYDYVVEKLNENPVDREERSSGCELLKDLSLNSPAVDRSASAPAVCVAP